MSYIADQFSSIGLRLDYENNIPVNKTPADHVSVRFNLGEKFTNNIGISNSDLAQIYRILSGTGKKPELRKAINRAYKKAGFAVMDNRRRGLRRNQMRSSFDKPVFGPGQAEYKRIDTTTGAGMRLEQKMRRAGWYQAQVTPFSTVLYRKKRR